MIVENTIPVFLWPPEKILVLVTTFCFVTGVLPGLIMRRGLKLAPSWAPQPPFHAAMIGFFALLLSFTALDAWRRNDAALGALNREAHEIDSVMPLLHALEASTVAGPAETRTALGEYITASLAEEWSVGNTRASERAEAGLDHARAVAAAGMMAGGSGAAVWRTVIDRIDTIETARATRLGAGGVYGDLLRWGALALLYVAGAVAVFAVHLDRPKAARLASGIYIAVGTVSLLVVALLEHPYTGWDAVTPDVLQTLLQRLRA